MSVQCPICGSPAKTITNPNGKVIIKCPCITWVAGCWIVVGLITFAISALLIFRVLNKHPTYFSNQDIKFIYNTTTGEIRSCDTNYIADDCKRTETFLKTCSNTTNDPAFKETVSNPMDK